MVKRSAATNTEKRRTSPRVLFGYVHLEATCIFNYWLDSGQWQLH